MDEEILIFKSFFIIKFLCLLFRFLSVTSNSHSKMKKQRTIADSIGGIESKIFYSHQIKCFTGNLKFFLIFLGSFVFGFCLDFHSLTKKH